MNLQSYGSDGNMASFDSAKSASLTRR